MMLGTVGRVLGRAGVMARGWLRLGGSTERSARRRGEEGRRWMAVFRSGAIATGALLPIGLASLLLVGCGNDDPPAPSPTPNPAAHMVTKLHVTVSDPTIDNVLVESDWVMGNIDCAPIVGFAGHAKMKQVTVNDRALKTNDGYEIRLLEDRFMTRGKCNWQLGALAITFVRNKHGISQLVATTNDLLGAKRTWICTGRWMGGKQIGICFSNGNLPSTFVGKQGNFDIITERMP